MAAVNDRPPLLNPVCRRLVAVALLPLLSGCFDWSTLKPPAGDPPAEAEAELGDDEETGSLAGPATPADAFALADVEPRHRLYLDAARPFIDDFLPAHNLASVERLAAHLDGLPPRRPVRRSRPWTSALPTTSTLPLNPSGIS